MFRLAGNVVGAINLLCACQHNKFGLTKLENGFETPCGHRDETILPVSLRNLAA